MNMPQLTEPSNILYEAYVDMGEHEDEQLIFKSHIFYGVYVSAVQYAIDHHLMVKPTDPDELDALFNTTEGGKCYEAWMACQECEIAAIGDDKVWIEGFDPV